MQQIENISNIDANYVNVPTTFSLKKEESMNLTPKSENNTTAIGYHQFIQKKGQAKTTSSTLSGSVKGQIEFAKEVSQGKQQQIQMQKTSMVFKEKEDFEKAKLETARKEEAAAIERVKKESERKSKKRKQKKL